MEDKFSQHYSNVSQTYGTYAKKIEISSGVPTILRVVGDRNDFVAYLESWILCDDDVKRPFIIKNELGKSLLYDLIGDKDNFYKGGFLESVKDPKTNKPKYIWQMKDPELFNLFMYNNNLSGADGSWKPRPNYVYNAILRNLIAEENKMINWCEENQHTMLFILNPTGFKSLGDLIQMNGKISEYDICYLKTGTGFDTKHNIYKAVPDDSGKNPEFNIAVIGPLSEEELYYGRYNLNKESALTPYTKILERLGNAIERASSVMQRDWIGQFQKEVSYEVQEETAGGSTTHSAYTASQYNDTDKEPEWVSQGTTVEAKPVVQEAPVSVNETPAPTDVKTPVRTARVPKTESTSTVEMEPCHFCKEQIAKNLEVCPKCGNTLMEACTDCGKPFSVSASTCPHCGKEYDLVV